MIDFGHILLFFFALVATAWGYLANKRMKNTDKELSTLKFEKMAEEVKNESLNLTNDERIRRFNERYSKGSRDS